MKVIRDNVYTRTSLHETKQKLCVADILRYKQCINRYLLQYKRDLDDSIFCNLEDFVEELKEQQFSLIVENSLNIQKTGYTISYCKDLLNIKLKHNFNNRQVKSSLTDY